MRYQPTTYTLYLATLTAIVALAGTVLGAPVPDYVLYGLLGITAGEPVRGGSPIAPPTDQA